MRSRHIVSGAFAALLLVAVAAPVVGAWLLAMRQDPIDAVNSQVPAVYAAPSTRSLDGRQPATINMVWATGKGLVAPGWSGTVTGLPVASGTTLEEGQVVIEIDGIGRMAAATSSPFYRSLGPESAGGDVRDLNQFLGRLGLSHGRADTWTATTTAGVKSLQARLNVEPELPEFFDPAWVVWLPAPTFQVGSTDVTLGSPAPSAGTPFLTPFATLTGAQLVKQDGSVLSLDAATSWTFTADNDAQFALTTSDPGAARVADLQALSAAVAPSQESLSGAVAFTQSVVATAVPVEAVITGVGGMTCVWLRPEGSADPAPQVVSVLSGDVSATYLSDVLPVGSSILVNPSEILADPHC